MAGAGAAALGAALRPAAPLPALPAVELAGDAPAGSVREVSSIGQSLTSISQLARLAQFTQLRSLVLHGGPLRSLEGLAACAGTLEELNLSGNELGVCAGLGALPKLKMLNLVRAPGGRQRRRARARPRAARPRVRTRGRHVR